MTEKKMNHKWADLTEVESTAVLSLQLSAGLTCDVATLSILYSAVMTSMCNTGGKKGDTGWAGGGRNSHVTQATTSTRK